MRDRVRAPEEGEEPEGGDEPAEPVPVDDSPEGGDGSTDSAESTGAAPVVRSGDPGRDEERIPKFTKHSLNLRETLEVLFVITERRIRMWGRFKISALFSIIGALISIFTFFIINEIIGPSLNPYYARYGGNTGFFDYVLIGMAFGTFAATSLGVYLSIIQTTYWGNTLELILSSPMRFYTYFFSTVLWAFFTSTLSILMYLGIGVAVFGLDLGNIRDFNLLVTILTLSIIAISGLGLISASMFLYYDVKGQVEPVSWFISTAAGLVAGIMFPPEIFLDIAPPLFWLSRILPHTYALRSFRYVVQGQTMHNPLVVSDLFALILFCLMLLPLGAVVFQKSMLKAEREGKLARWGA